MARKYKVEGTKDFLYAAIVLFALGAWAIRDGWFPSESVLEKHPRTLPLAFEQGGVVADILVAPDDEVKSGQALVILQRFELESRLAALEKSLKSLDEPGMDDAPDGAARRAEARARWTAELAETRAALAQRELRAPTNGYVAAVLVERNALVRPKATAVELAVKDHFYAFNKSLAFLSITAALVCLYIHYKVK